MSPTPRTTLRRHRERGRYDRDLVHAIIDEALVAHVGFTSSHGPVVLPMAHPRVGDDLYLHGARANALLGALTDGAPAHAPRSRSSTGSCSPARRSTTR